MECEGCAISERECIEHGDICGACGSFIIEEAEEGDGEARYHGRTESCYVARTLTF